ncbi:hypothetical protein [Francisella philomiragia]|uniref:hypothetical protein n=1 Tax=Francisella philomiragia TaxID=28110 RepID=UPI001B8C416F|nr:hypothetical protein [Francisella philomiragia]QUE31649.1 hypothetical protein IMS64_01170 [Francisella philomiragia]
MSTETVVNQINENLNQQFNKPDFTAQLSELMYAESLNTNTAYVDSNGKATLYSQFYDNSGNVRGNITGDVKTYLENHKTDSSFVTKLQDYNVVAISGDNLDGYAGMVISPQDNNKEAIHISRGSESPLTHPNDWINNAEMGLLNVVNPLGIKVPENSLQFQSAKELLKEAKRLQPQIEVVSTTGHSQGGALAIAMERVIIQTQGLTLGWTKAYNPPGFATSATEGMTEHQVSEMKSKTQIISVVGDPVSETFSDHLVPPIKVYSDAPAGVDKHYMAPMVTENKTSLYTDYINSDNSINVKNVSESYNSLVSQENAIKSEMANNASDSWLDYVKSTIPDSIQSLAGITNYTAQLESIAQQKAGLAEILKGSVTSFAGEVEFWSQEFGQHSPELAEMLELNRCIEPSLLINKGAEQTQSTILDFIGGENNKKLLDSLIDSIKSQPTTEAKNQFIASLKDNPLIKNIMDSTFGIQSDDLVDIADNLADINRSSQQAQVFRGDPLTFDLDGDGIETVSVDDGVLFDHQSTGVKEGTGWVSADDGLLVRDLDGNGTIDSGRELFGDNTLKADGTKAAHGFEALAELDSNADGIIDANDTEFENLQVWQDTNSDGISQANELKNLSQVGVSSIDLTVSQLNETLSFIQINVDMVA